MFELHSLFSYLPRPLPRQNYHSILIEEICLDPALVAPGAAAPVAAHLWMLSLGVVILSVPDVAENEQTGFGAVAVDADEEE